MPENIPYVVNGTTVVPFEKFEEHFRPILVGATEDDAPYCGWMFETYGEQFERVKAHPEDCIWTLLDVDQDGGDDEAGSGQLLVSGFHVVNRAGYILTEVPIPAGAYIEVQD